MGEPPKFEWQCKGAPEIGSNCGKCPKCLHFGWEKAARPAGALLPNSAPTGVWINSKDRLPEQGMLIVKRWTKKGSQWAGRYSGSHKDVSFDQWLRLPEN